MIQQPPLTAMIFASLVLCASALSVAADDAPRVLLDEALRDFAIRNELHLVYRSELVAGKTLEAYTPAGDGADPGAELNRLLGRSGLIHRFVNDRTVAIESADQARDTDSDGNRRGQQAAELSSSEGTAETPDPKDDGTEDRPAQGEGAGNAAAPVEEVIVTGSRIRRGRIDVTAPLTVIDGDYLRDRGYGDLGLALQAEASAASSLVASSDTVNANLAGLSSANLRGLTRGASNRTLVLVNGRRQTSGIAGTSDVNLADIPISRVERVEIITGASSSVYGTDAIAGVVNIILKERHEGFDYAFRLQGTEHGDGDEKYASLTWGKSFDQGSLMVNIVRTETKPALRANRGFLDPRKLSRLFFSFDLATLSLTTQLRNNATDPRINSTGLLRRLSLAFEDDGGLVPFDAGELQPNLQSIGGGGAVIGEGSSPYLTFPVERTQLATTFQRTLTSGSGFFRSLDAFGEVTLTRTDSGHLGGIVDLSALTESSSSIGPVVIDPGNPFLSPEAAGILASASPRDRVFTRRFHEFGRNALDTEASKTNFLVGLRGELPKGYNFDISYSIDRSERDLVYRSVNRSNLKQAVEAVRDPATGEPACMDPSGGCVPIDPFGFIDVNGLSPALIEFLYFAPKQNETTQLEVASATLTGKLLSLDAGPMRFALNLEYRKDLVGIDANADALISSYAHTLGNYDYSDADYSVREARAELNIPLLAGKQLVNRLSVDLSGNIGDYSHIKGAVYSWKAGLAYAPFEYLRFRLALGSAVRAPNHEEIANPSSERFLPTLDRCSNLALRFSREPEVVQRNCEARGVNLTTNNPYPVVLLQMRRNPELDTETAQTLTAGLTFEPPFAPGLVLKTDYFDINTKGVIRFLDGRTAHFDCVNDSAGDGSSPACDFVIRDANGTINTILSQYENLDKLASKGIDLELRYSLGLGDGLLDLSFTGTRLESSNLTPYTGVLRQEVGWPGRPRKKYSMLASYSRGPITASVTRRFQDALDTSFGGLIQGLPEARRVVYYDASARWKISDRFELTLGAINVLGTRPKSQVALNVPFYDVIGRRVFASLRGSL